MRPQVTTAESDDHRSILNFFISPVLRKDPETYRRTRLVVGTCLGMLFLGFSSLTVNPPGLTHPMTWVHIFPMALCVVGLLALRFRHALLLASFLMVFGLACAVAVGSLVTGGLAGQTLYWNAFIILFGSFIIGSRAGLWVASFAMIQPVLFWGIHRFTPLLPEQTPGHPPGTRAFNISMFLGLSWLVAWLFDNARARAFSALEDSVEREKQAEVARKVAEAASIAKSNFLATMSHELRTPLNAIIGYSEMLREDVKEIEPEAMVADLDRICHAGRHLLALINDILDLSKIEAGKMDLNPEPFALGELVKEVEQTAKTLVMKNHNTFYIHVEDPELALFTDRVKLRQCLLNLVGNASKFTEGGKISLTVKTAQIKQVQHVVFEVEDTGIGMDEGQLAHLFDMFTQADSSTSRKYGGSGLGLAITKRLCHLLKGDVTVQSVEGQGSIFTIEIPVLFLEQGLNPLTSEATVFRDTDIGAWPEAVRQTILVIDDDPNVVDLLTRLFTREGFQVVSATSGEGGLRIAEKLCPFAITLDVKMPDMDGWTVLSTLKKNPALHNTPVIMVTIEDDCQKGYALGASEFITKPFERQVLLSALKKYQPAHRQGKVLVVEDDENSRELLLGYLTRDGWGVEQAVNGIEALENIEANGLPDLILLDLMMPEMDGFQFLSVFREQEDTGEVPVLIITAKELTPEEREQLNGRVSHILQKGGFSREELLEKVRSLVRAHLHSQHHQ